jgi:multidrug efflux pump subunit AcrB
MDIAKFAIKKNVFTYFLSVLILLGGIYSFENLGRLEDPEFAIKDALVVTHYPGASAKEVEDEVTEKIETAIQELGQLDEIVSMSRPGVSTITVTIKDKYDKNKLPQVWDELRRKVNDVQSSLPPGVSPSVVKDDYGDVFGALLTVYGNDYTYKELKDFVDFLKTELSLAQDVAKITIWGDQQEEIFVEISRARMSQLGVRLDEIYSLLAQQNLVTPSGKVRVGDEYIRIEPTGAIDSVDEIKNLVISGEDQRMIYLKDIAEIRRGYIDPPNKHLRYNSDKSIAMGISTVSGGNVVVMGDALNKRLKELGPEIPLGISIEPIYFQADSVTTSINNFVVSLIQALVIVIVVLVIFMGFRSAILIGVSLLLTIMASLIVMDFYNIDLQRISLGALIIALGMLVDNAIVVNDGILVKIQQGVDKLEAASSVVKQNMWPLLGATVIAVLAFAAIGMSQDSTGEYTRSLFQVLLISLMISWIIAITVVPLMCVNFLKFDTKSDADPYSGTLFLYYKSLLTKSIKHRSIVIVIVLGALAASIVGFGWLEDSFFPNSTSKQFYVHYWLPEGTDIRKTSQDSKEIEEYISGLEGVDSVATFVGGGAPRFMLVYSPEKEYSSYAFILVTAKDYTLIDGLLSNIKEHISQKYISANPKYEKVRLGPGGGFMIEARFLGSDPNVLRGLSEKAKDIMENDGGIAGVRDDWRERLKLVEPVFADEQASKVGVTRAEISQSLQSTFGGLQVGTYRESDNLIPIVSQPPIHERVDIDNIYDMQVWSSSLGKTIPLRQVVKDFNTSWEDAVIHRRDKRVTITAQGDPKEGNASVALARIKKDVESIPLPPGYSFEWGGEYKDSADAQKSLFSSIPATVILMILVTVALFNALRQPLIIWMTVPLAIIGVTWGLLFAKESFGFMALLGFLSLIGMLIKNAIVLIDEIDMQIASGKERYQALIEASISRLRPVMMAAGTTILGMLPLLADVFFVGMAVTIMSGLAFASILTLIVVPVFYSMFFRITPNSK